MRKLIIILTLSASSFVLGQDKKIFSFDFGMGINGYEMQDVNEFYIDSSASKPGNDLLQDHVEHGQCFRIGVNFRPISWLDFGLFGNYQFSSLKSRPWHTYTESDGTVKKSLGEYELRTEAVSGGVSSTIYISDLLNFQEKKNLLNRIHFGVELNGGLVFSKISTLYLFETFVPFERNDVFYSRDFQGQIGLKAEYDFTITPIITSLGLRAGYQFLKTGIVRDSADQEWKVNDEHPISLDFSGIYFGVYLKIGK